MAHSSGPDAPNANGLGSGDTLGDDALVVLLSYVTRNFGKLCAVSQQFNRVAPEAARRRLELVLNRTPRVPMMSAAMRRGRHLMRVVDITEYRRGHGPAPRPTLFADVFCIDRGSYMSQNIEGWPVNFLADSFERWRESAALAFDQVITTAKNEYYQHLTSTGATNVDRQKVHVWIEVATFVATTPDEAQTLAPAAIWGERLLGSSAVGKAVLSGKRELQRLCMAPEATSSAGPASSAGPTSLGAAAISSNPSSAAPLGGFTTSDAVPVPTCAYAMLRAGAPCCIALALRYYYRDRNVNHRGEPSYVVRHPSPQNGGLHRFVVQAWPEVANEYPASGWIAAETGQRRHAPPPVPSASARAAALLAAKTAAEAAAKAAEAEAKAAVRERACALLVEKHGMEPSALEGMSVGELRELARAMSASAGGGEGSEEEDESSSGDDD